MRFSKVYFVFKPFVIWKIIISWGLSKRDFDGSQISVTTGGFTLRTVYMLCSYLIHEAIRPDRLGGLRVMLRWLSLVVKVLNMEQWPRG